MIADAAALADGDPASDILAPARHPRLHDERRARNSSLEKKLADTTQQVSDAGLPIKVAVIGNKTDLGAVPQLWGKPQTYARFLGAELRFVYKDTLLVVMPQGFGINGPFPQASKAIAALPASIRARTRRPRGSRTRPTRRCARWPPRTASRSRAAAAGAAAACRCR